jgi:serine/threonine protein phosphatase PrpC
MMKTLKERATKGDKWEVPVEELLESICAENTDEAIGTDNMTAILVKLNNENLTA